MTSERCELLIGLGEAQRQTGDPELPPDAARAPHSSPRSSNDIDRLAAPCWPIARGWITASQLGAVDAERVRALEAATQSPPGRRPATGAGARAAGQRASLRRGAGAVSGAGGGSDRDSTGQRRSGDAGPHAHQRHLRRSWAPDTLGRAPAREERADRARRGSLDDPRLSFWAAGRRMVVGLEAGERSQIESGLATMRTLARRPCRSRPSPGRVLAASRRAGPSFRATSRHQSDGRSRHTRSVPRPAEPDAATALRRPAAAGSLHPGPPRGAGRAGSCSSPASRSTSPAWRAAAALALLESGRRG